MHLSEIWHSKKNDCRLSRTQVIQIEHNFFEGQRKTVSTKWRRRLVSDGCTSGLSPVRQCSCRAYQQLTPTQLIRRMGAGLVIVYGLGLILPLPPTVVYLYPLVSSMSSQMSVANGLRAAVPLPEPIVDSPTFTTSLLIILEPARMALAFTSISSALGIIYFCFIIIYIFRC